MIRRIVVLAVTVAFFVMATALPARADDEVGLSRDGVTWSPSLTASLFDDPVIWVPGDSDTVSFFARNGAATPGEVTVDVTAGDPDLLLADDAVVLEARLADGAWTPVADGTTQLAPAALDIEPGARVRVQLRATFRPETTDHQDHTVPLSVLVFMEEDGDVGGIIDEDDGDGDGDGDVGGIGDGVLPDTGSGFGLGVIWLAAGLIGAGLALLRRRRNEHEEHEKVAFHG